MPVLNHHIVAAHDKRATALFFAEMLGLEPPAMPGELAIVEARNDRTLDFVDTDDEIHRLHDAFGPSRPMRPSTIANPCTDASCVTFEPGLVAPSSV